MPRAEPVLVIAENEHSFVLPQGKAVAEVGLHPSDAVFVSCLLQQFECCWSRRL